MNSSFKTLGLLLLLALFFLNLEAQYLIENPSGDINTSPIADDVNVCYPDGESLAFRIIKGAGSTGTATLTTTLATGREYIDGTISIDSESGGPFTLGPNIGTPSIPQFVITGTWDPGDHVELSMDVRGTCGAINNNGETHLVDVDGVNEISTTHDALFLTLSFSGLTAVTTNVGDSETLEGTIVGGGNGCVEELVLMLIDDAGVTTTELRVEGNTLAADSMNGDTMYYTITQAEISQVGDMNDCYDALEMLNFERDVDITSCDLDAAYQAFWGCDEERCIITAVTPHQINLAFTIPDINYTGGTVIKGTNLCDSTEMEWTFTNEGSGDAYNIDFLAGFNASGDVLTGYPGNSPRNFPVYEVSVNGVVIAFVTGTDPGVSVDLQAFGMDPDNAGGLDDLDLDGGFDDLPAGESYTITMKQYITPNQECPVTHSSGAWRGSNDYEDQCGEPIERVVTVTVGSLSIFTLDGPGVAFGPSDIYEGETVSIEVCGTQRFSGSLLDCPTDLLTLVGDIPGGFTLVGGSAMINNTPVLDEMQSNDSIFISGDFKPSSNTCFTFDLTLDCSEYSSADPDFIFEFIYLCDEDCGETLRFSCPEYNPLVHCPKPCPEGGLTTQRTSVIRTTMGFVSPTDLTRVDPSTVDPVQLTYAMPCDTVCISATSLQIAGSEPGADGPWDNGWFQISYDPTGSAENLTYTGGTVDIFDASAGSITTHPMPLPTAETFTTAQHKADFDLSSLIPGGGLAEGDSVNVNLKAHVNLTSGISTAGPVTLPLMRLRHYNLRDTTPLDMILDTTTCDVLSLALGIHRPTYGGGGGVNKVAQGCNGYNQSAHDRWNMGPDDWYPGEIRPFARLDSFEFRWNSKDIIDTSSVRLLADGKASEGYDVDVFPGAADKIVTIGDEVRHTWINDGTWPVGDQWATLGGNSGYTTSASFIPSCESQDGTGSFRWYTTTNYYAYDESCYANRVNSNPYNINQIKPGTDLTNLSGNVQITQDTVCWDVRIENPSPGVSKNVFVGFEDLAVAGVNVIELKDIDADTLIPLMAYGEGDWAVTTINLPPASFQLLKVTGVLTECSLDSVLMVGGFECVEPPVDPSAYVCELDSVYLGVTPLDSRVQIELAQEAAPYDICTEIDDTITVTSALDAYITDLLLCIPVPNGLTENDLMAVIEYPKESGDMQMVPITFVDDPVRDTAYIDIMQHSVIAMQNGIPGTQDANTAEEAIVDVFVTWITDCEFTVGETYEPFIYANRPCGDPAIDNGVSTVSDPLTIVGVDPPFLSVIEPEVSTDTIEGCQPEELMLSSTIIVGQSTDNDSIFITLPEGTSYTDGSYMCTIAPPGDTACPVFVEVREIGGLDQVVLSIPAGIGNVTELTFDLEFMAEPGDACNENRIITIDAISSVGGIFCPTTGMNCSNLQVLTGQATDTIFFKKSDVNFDVIEVCTENDMYLISGELALDSVDIVANDSIVIEVFCSSDLSGSIATIVFDGPIVAGAVLPFNEQIAANCPEGDQMYFKVDPGSGNCICALVDTLVDINPPIEVEAGEPLSICQNKMVTLSDLGASISGGATDGIWSTMGDGTFGPSYIFSEAETYTPGAADISAGEVVLRLTSDDPDGECGPQFDDVRIDIRQVNCGTFPWDGN